MKKILITFLVCLATLVYCVSETGYSQEVLTDSKTIYEQVISIETDEDLRNFYAQLPDMTVEQLEEVINVAESLSQERYNGSTAVLKAAWLAAAQVARASGYPLSATLVEHSVWNTDYTETDGMFANAIKSTTVYDSIFGYNSGSGTFERSDNLDLFYSIHGFWYNTLTSYGEKTLVIHDIYDFKLEDYSQNLFTKLVNNWAYLNQHMNVLMAINVRIEIT